MSVKKQTRPAKKATLNSKLEEKAEEVADGPEKEDTTKDGHPEEEKSFE